jgi:hypothetical protein
VHLLVAIELLERVDELGHQLVRERVQLRGAVEEHDRDRLLALDQN